MDAEQTKFSLLYYTTQKNVCSKMLTIAHYLAMLASQLAIATFAVWCCGSGTNNETSISNKGYDVQGKNRQW